MDSPVDTIEAPAEEGSSSSHRSDLRDLGEYRLLKRLGTGGMGHVYKAMHRRMERLVAIKVLPSYRADDPQAQARFDREIKANGRLNHPNLVHAFDAQEIDGTRFLAMEYIDGVNLSLLVRTSGPLRIADACELISQAALGLQAAHQRGLVHRDIKPSNLMLSRAGQLKVLDLGLARFRAERLDAEEMTDIGETIGTAEYIAPEQVADSHHVDIRADIYSLGCTMYKLLTGQPPFHGAKYPSAVEKMMAHMKEPPPAIQQLRDDVSDLLAAVIARMTAKDPDQRFSSPAEVAEALAPYASGSDLGELMRRFDAGERAAGSENRIREQPGTSSVAADRAPARSLRGKATSLQFTPTYRLAISAASLGLLVLLFVAVSYWLPRTVGAMSRETPATEAVAKQPQAGGDLCGRAMPLSHWVDLLPCIDLDRDRVSDNWERRLDGVGCRGSSGYPRVAVPVTLDGNYEMEVEFTRNAGDGLVRILFPVGNQNGAQLLLGAGDRTLFGLNDFNGRKMSDADNPGVRRLPPLVSGKRYKVLVGVAIAGKEATIDARLDGATLFHCAVPPSVFPPLALCGLADRTRPEIGVEAGSEVTFHAVRMRLDSGTAAIRPRRPTEPCPQNQWVDLLPQIDVARDAVAGACHREVVDVDLDAGAAEGILMLPAAVRGSYELSIEFTHGPEASGIAFIVPVGMRRVRVNVNKDGELHPEPWSINRPEGGVIEAGTRHTLSLKVNVDESQASIDIRLDDHPWLHWNGEQTELHDGPILLSEGDRIGLVARESLAIHAARLRMISGTGGIVLGQSEATHH